MCQPAPLCTSRPAAVCFALHMRGRFVLDVARRRESAGYRQPALAPTGGGIRCEMRVRRCDPVLPCCFYEDKNRLFCLFSKNTSPVRVVFPLIRRLGLRNAKKYLEKSIKSKYIPQLDEVLRAFTDVCKRRGNADRGISSKVRAGRLWVSACNRSHPATQVIRINKSSLSGRNKPGLPWYRQGTHRLTNHGDG